MNFPFRIDELGAAGGVRELWVTRRGAPGRAPVGPAQAISTSGVGISRNTTNIYDPLVKLWKKNLRGNQKCAASLTIDGSESVLFKWMQFGSSGKLYTTQNNVPYRTAPLCSLKNSGMSQMKRMSFSYSITL